MKYLRIARVKHNSDTICSKNGPGSGTYFKTSVIVAPKAVSCLCRFACKKIQFVQLKLFPIITHFFPLVLCGYIQLLELWIHKKIPAECKSWMSWRVYGENKILVFSKLFLVEATFCSKKIGIFLNMDCIHKWIILNCELTICLSYNTGIFLR